MSATQQVAGHIKRTIDGPMWHGPALAELLAGVTREQAAVSSIAARSSG